MKIRLDEKEPGMEFVEIFEGERARQFDSNIRSRIPGYETILQLATAAIASIRPAGSILSVGCGTGQDILHLARNPAYRITAIDPSSDMVALAAARFRELGIERIDLRCCAVSDLPDEPRYDAADFARTEAFSEDLSVLRACLDLFSSLAPDARDEYVARVRDRLHLISPADYPDRARRAGFRAIRRLYPSLHVHGWILER